jgi:hypothetical protein
VTGAPADGSASHESDAEDRPDEGEEHNPAMGSSDTSEPADFFNEADSSVPNSPGPASPQQPPAWVPPPDPVVVDQYGLVGHFADERQSSKPPHAELLKLQPGHDGSVLVRASAVTIEEALQGMSLLQACCVLFAFTSTACTLASDYGCIAQSIAWH